MSKSPITCHVLDSSTGKPAAGVEIRLQEYLPATTNEGTYDIFEPLGKGTTDDDGRCLTLLPPADSEEAKQPHKQLVAGRSYKIVFKTQEYFERTNRKSFYPWVEITFTLGELDEHYHIPLLISPYSFTTYRGS